MDTFRSGQVTISGSAQQLSIIPKGVNSAVIKALNGNVGVIYVGSDNSVSSATGFELAAGESIPVTLVNPSKLWVIGTANDKLCWASVGA